MAKTKTETTPETPVFKSEKTSAKQAPVAKLSIKRMSVNDLKEEIDRLMTQVEESGIEPKQVKGVLTLF